VANFTAGKSFASSKPKAEPKIIHQTFFKSVGPRTYAAQIKEIANGNHLLVLTEGKRDEKTDEVRKTRLFVYAEDFPEMFKMLDDARAYIEAHPVSKAAQAKRQKFWEKQNQNAKVAVKAPAGAAETEQTEEDDLDT
jgi:tRNA A37 N6-isopentenylltransferase MiaA